MTSKNIIQGFDLLKYLMAILIISAHSSFAFTDFPILTALLNPLRRIAVPLFFTLSSYFFFRKIESKGTSWISLQKTFLRLSKIYFFWFVVCLPITYIKNPYFDNMLGPIYLIRDILFSSTFPGSWFLSALMIALTLIFCFIKLNFKSRFIAFIALLCYMFLHFCSGISLFNLLQKIFREELSLTFINGIIWCTLGYFLSKESVERSLNKLKKYKLYLILFFFFIYCFNILLSKDIFICELSKVIEIVLLFYIFKFLSFKRNFDSSLYRNKSILYFFLHFRVISIYSHLGMPTHKLYFFIAVFITTDILSTLIFKMQNLKYFKWLKYSY